MGAKGLGRFHGKKQSIILGRTAFCRHPSLQFAGTEFDSADVLFLFLFCLHFIILSVYRFIL